MANMTFFGIYPIMFHWVVAGEEDMVWSARGGAPDHVFLPRLSHHGITCIIYANIQSIFLTASAGREKKWWRDVAKKRSIIPLAQHVYCQQCTRIMQTSGGWLIYRKPFVRHVNHAPTSYNYNLFTSMPCFCVGSCVYYIHGTHILRIRPSQLSCLGSW